MAKPVTIDGRLSAAARLVQPGRTVADIGTDHAYLPVYLVQNGIADRVIAADIRSGPLQSAAATVEKYACGEQITLRLSDGLRAFAPFEAEEIVICGMGGELIAGILNAAPWVRSERVHLILQPMSQPETLRRWLCENGFVIQQEQAAVSAGRSYAVLSVRYDGVSRPCSALYAYTGELAKVKTPQAAVCRALCCRRVRKKAAGLKMQNPASGEAAALFALALQIEEIDEAPRIKAAQAEADDRA